MYTATVSGRGIIHLPAELRRKYRIRPGDKVDLRPVSDGIRLERVPTLEEAFGQYRQHGRNWARELLAEKRAELDRELGGPRRGRGR